MPKKFVLDMRPLAKMGVLGFAVHVLIWCIFFLGISPYSHENKARQGIHRPKTNAPKIALYNATDPHAKTPPNVRKCINYVYFFMVSRSTGSPVPTGETVRNKAH